MERSTTDRSLSRRGILKLAGAAGAGAGVIGAATGTASAVPAAPKGGFAHPGLLHTQADFDRMAEKVKAGAQPWTDGWKRLLSSRDSATDYRPRPVATVTRAAEGANVHLLFRDAAAAYQNALRWKITGDTRHADKARDILNGWSATLRELRGDSSRYLMAGIQGYQLANAGEIMRDYDGFDLGRFQSMMVDIFYPMNDSFLVNHNDAVPTNYRANWELCTLASIIAIGGLTEDQAKIDRAVEYFKNGDGNGCVKRAVPILHEEADGVVLGQWEESGRDQEHTMAGVGWMGALCEMAWNLGEDLYGYADNRFMKGCEYVARYNLGKDVPYTSYSRRVGRRREGQPAGLHTEPEISDQGRGSARPIWALIHNHYAVRRGLDVPNITAYRDKLMPEDGGGLRGGAGWSYDHLGYGTLTYTRDPKDVRFSTPGAAREAEAADGASRADASGSGAGGGTRPQGGAPDDLAATGAGDVLAWSAAGASALVGGLLLLRRRGRSANAPGSDA
ncbi:alginate lyase family protein [Streptomyces sp. TRM68367]|uniref:alginate lyase family protein n=1 Tax=Streptomyces sp. TRM68367 TaxID=2758415 RepID=UPI00165CA53A|nr:alginate lyase family protein [Streptomyces sp. TRM68367]MBC9731203.1 alginate lyase family protein [Streptomyces sp. TRM68367]